MAQGLTDAEAAIYDRQIRLWGVEAQQRMRASRVLVAGLGALGAEVTKNLVLAGTAVTVQDEKAATLADVGVQFFLREAHVGQNVSERGDGRVCAAEGCRLSATRPRCARARPPILQRAEASKPAVAELNPLVEVRSLSEPIDSLSDEELRSHRLIILTDSSPVVWVRARLRACGAGLPFPA
jgi:molybdopterin/thiamine biosynthesis adenylyltransferase